MPVFCLEVFFLHFYHAPCLGQHLFIRTQLVCSLRWLCNQVRLYYEAQLISNAHSAIYTKGDHVFKQMKVGSKVQYFSYKLTYLFSDMVALSFNTFFPTWNKFTHAVNEEFRSSLFDPRRRSLFHFIIWGEMSPLEIPLEVRKEMEIAWR